MSDPGLPDDLADVERRLMGAPRRQTAADFRGRLLTAVRRELRDAVPPAIQRDWQFVAAVAAVALLCANFSMSIASDADWPEPRRSPPADAKSLTVELHSLLPDLSEQELRRHAFLAQTGWLLPIQVDAWARAYSRRPPTGRSELDEP